MHVDLGLATRRVATDCQDNINIDDNLTIAVPYKDKPYYLITLNTEYRKNINCLSTLIKHINRVPEKRHSDAKYGKHANYSLLI